MQQPSSTRHIVDELYLRALSHLPSNAQRQRLVQLIDEAKPEERRQAIEDLLWSILSSREFLFNH